MQLQLEAVVMTEQREIRRRRVCFAGRIVHERILSDTACRLRDLSCGGARLRLSGTVPLPGLFDLVVACRQAAYRAEVVWRAGDEVGVRFLPEPGVPEDARVVALRESLRESRAEAGRLRERLAMAEAGARPAAGTLH